MENDDKKQGPDVTQKTAQADARQNPMPEITKENWDKSKQMWSESAGGRAIIRLFSRGIMGAAFFQTGGLLVQKWMYSQHHQPYAPHLGFKAQLFGEKAHLPGGADYKGNPLKFTAKLIDEGVSKPIQSVAEFLSGDKTWAKKFVSFRPIHFPGYETSGPAFKEIRGRSLGHEAVAITFDFFCASVGDAFGRDIADMLDPNNKHKPWRNDNGDLDIANAAKSAAKAVFRYITYNGGEDWFVAIPYAFFMKGQRHLINKVSPGFAADFDQSMNGGSIKVNNKGQMIGSFYKEGAFDLQSRFTVYNIGTLMFRELYDKAEHAWNGDKVNLYGSPDEKRPDRGVLGSLADVGKWMARSAIKGAIYMTPAVPFFWITRSTQSRHRGNIINKDLDGALLCYINKDGDRRSLNFNEFYDHHNKRNMSGAENIPAYFASLNYDYTERKNAYERYPTSKVSDLHPGFKGVSPYQVQGGPIEAMANKIGRWSYDSSQFLDGFAKQVDQYAENKGGFADSIKRGLGLPKFKNSAGIPQGFERFTRPAIHAAVAYTPYMYAKAEFANLWDNGKMDLAAERAIDGATRLNWGEFKAGLAEIGRAFTAKPFDDPAREAEAARRNQVDTSAADDSVKADRGKAKQAEKSPAMKEASEFIEKDLEKMVKKHARPEMKKSGAMEEASQFISDDLEKMVKKHARPEMKKDGGLSWRERAIKGNDEEHELVTTTKHAPHSHSEREEMLRFLQKAQPPTKSLN